MWRARRVARRTAGLGRRVDVEKRFYVRLAELPLAAVASLWLVREGCSCSGLSWWPRLSDAHITRARLVGHHGRRCARERHRGRGRRRVARPPGRSTRRWRERSTTRTPAANTGVFSAHLERRLARPRVALPRPSRRPRRRRAQCGVALSATTPPTPSRSSAPTSSFFSSLSSPLSSSAPAPTSRDAESQSRLLALTGEKRPPRDRLADADASVDRLWRVIDVLRPRPPLQIAREGSRARWWTPKPSRHSATVPSSIPNGTSPPAFARARPIFECVACGVPPRTIPAPPTGISSPSPSAFDRCDSSTIVRAFDLDDFVVVLFHYDGEVDAWRRCRGAIARCTSARGNRRNGGSRNGFCIRTSSAERSRLFMGRGHRRRDGRIRPARVRSHRARQRSRDFSARARGWERRVAGDAPRLFPPADGDVVRRCIVSGKIGEGNPASTPTENRG